MKYSQEDLQGAYDHLIRNESIVRTFLGGLIGAVIACAFYWLLASMQAILFIFLIVPPAAIGYFAKMIGKPYQMKTRIPIGILAVIVHLLAIDYFQMNLLLLIFTPIAFAEAYINSRVQAVENRICSARYGRNWKN